MTLLSGEQRPNPAAVGHQGDLLVWTLHPALGPASLLGDAAQPIVPSQVLLGWWSFAIHVVLHLGKVFAVCAVGCDTWDFRGFSLLQLAEGLKATSSVVCGGLSSICLWAGRSQKGSRGLHLPLLPAWVRRSKTINQETFQHLPLVFTESLYKCLCIFYSTLKSQCS